MALYFGPRAALIRRATSSEVALQPIHDQALDELSPLAIEAK
jgi:hypothetical protein